MAMVFESRAIGGPLDGVKITAQLNWNGSIKNNKQSSNNSIVAYPGHYRWSTIRNAWIWHADKDKPTTRVPGKAYHRAGK